MGNCIDTTIIHKEICNYHCPICMQSGHLPNINGKFFLIDDFHCQCNGCHTIFDKFLYYKSNITFVEGTWSYIYVETDPVYVPLENLVQLNNNEAQN